MYACLNGNMSPKTDPNNAITCPPLWQGFTDCNVRMHALHVPLPKSQSRAIKPSACRYLSRQGEGEGELIDGREKSFVDKGFLTAP